MDGTPFPPGPVTVAGWGSAPCRPTAPFRALSVGDPSLRPAACPALACQPVPAGVTARSDGEAAPGGPWVLISLKLGRVATLAACSLSRDSGPGVYRNRGVRESAARPPSDGGAQPAPLFSSALRDSGWGCSGREGRVFPRRSHCFCPRALGRGLCTGCVTKPVTRF